MKKFNNIKCGQRCGASVTHILLEGVKMVHILCKTVLWFKLNMQLCYPAIPCVNITWNKWKYMSTQSLNHELKAAVYHNSSKLEATLRSIKKWRNTQTAVSKIELSDKEKGTRHGRPSEILYAGKKPKKRTFCVILFTWCSRKCKMYSLVVQWLRQYTSHAGAGVPGQGTKILYAPCCSQNRKKVTYWDRKQISVSLGLGVRWGWP